MDKNNFGTYIICIIFIIFILYKAYNSINNNTTPIIKQLNKYTENKIDKIFEKINNRPIYGNLPQGYTSSGFVGERTMKGDLTNEQIVEDNCPIGEYIKNFEIGESNGFINYIHGTCSNGKKLKILGKKINKSVKNNIKKEHGFNALNIKYDSSYLNEIYQVGKKNDNDTKLGCGDDHIIVGYRGRAENPNYNEDDEITDFRIKHLQFICNDKNAVENIPPTYRKCGDDGDICKFERNNQYIYYGVPGVKVVKIDKKKIKGNIFSCRPKGFFGIKGDTLPVEDPLPDMKKSCYLEMKGLTEKDIEKIINESKYKLYG
jgi:hypothetical protein